MSNPYEELGITDATARRLDAFGEARPPMDRDLFSDPTPAGSVTLTKGHVWTLRAALRQQMRSLLLVADQAYTISRSTGLPIEAVLDRDGFERETVHLLDIEEALVVAEAAASIPDVYPEGLL